MGTILRIASWYGIKNIICSHTTVDCYNAKVVQASMGAIAKVKVHYTNLDYFIKEVQLLNIPVYGAFLDGQNVFSINLPQSAIIVMGNEGNGISESLNQLITNRLTIPPFSKELINVESLNVSIATAILCTEFRRNFIV